MTGTQDTLSWPWHHCHPAASPDLPAWFLPQLCHGPRVTALPSLRSLVLVPIPKCLGTARGYPGRKDTACAVVPLGCSLALLLLPLSTFVGAVSSSTSSRTWVVLQTWLLQTVGQGAWGCELCDDRCCSPKTIGPQELRCLKGIPGSSRNIAKQVFKRQKRNELKANFQLLLGYKQGNKTNQVTVQCAFVHNALYWCIRNMYCGVFEVDSLYYILMNFSTGLVLDAAWELERGVGKRAKEGSTLE